MNHSSNPRLAVWRRIGTAVLALMVAALLVGGLGISGCSGRDAEPPSPQRGE